MPEIVTLPLADLLIDISNARLKDEQTSQQAAILNLVKQQDWRILKLAADIVDEGLDPLALIAVIPTPDQKKRYTVVEGNRRVVALKILETPSLAASAFNSANQKRLIALAKRFATDPINTLPGVLFQTEQEVNHWVRLRHTGQNDGIGLVEWGSDEQDRYNARHGHRSAAGKIIDFVEKYGGLSDAAQNSDKGIISSVTRLLSSPPVRDRLGIKITGDEVISFYPKAEAAKGLTKIIEDLKTGEKKVGDIYHAQDRIDYVNSLPGDVLPSPESRLVEPVSLNNLEQNVSVSGDASESSGDLGTLEPPQSAPTTRRPRGKPERTAIIPRECRIDISPPRINGIYNELNNISVDQYPNACSVTLRVFVELSVDHYLAENSLMNENDRRNKPLAKRIKVAAEGLHQTGKIDAQLKAAMEKVADSQGVLAASTTTFNQYAHNKYVYPKPTELRLAWDELQPFVEKLWA